MSIEAIKEALAAGPTDGPWINGQDDDSDYSLVGPADHDRIVCNPVVKLHDEITANFIAACNPQAIRSLIERLEAAELKVKELRGGKS